MRTRLLFLLAITVATQHGLAAAQSLAGALVGIVKDAQDRVVRGAVVRLTSQGPAGVQTQTTNETGQLRFPALPPGQYVLDIEAPVSFAKTGSALISIAVCVSEDGDLTNTIADVKAVRCAEYRGLHVDGA